jgi:hypothetical protein
MWRANSELRSLAGAAFGALNARDLDGFIAVAAEDVEFTSMVAVMEGRRFVAMTPHTDAGEVPVT